MFSFCREAADLEEASIGVAKQLVFTIKKCTPGTATRVAYQGERRLNPKTEQRPERQQRLYDVIKITLDPIIEQEQHGNLSRRPH